MRRQRMWALFALCSALLVSPAWAQDDEAIDEYYEDAADEAEPRPAPAASEGTAIESGNAPTEYVVQDGDTLWDLCKRFLNNPWYWPKVWSYNPEIENPHWIYPGNRVRFYPGAGALPAQIEPVTEIEELDEPTDLGDVALFEAPANLPEKLGGVHGSEQSLRRDRVFVTATELKDSGKVTGSMEDSEMLTLYQTVYLELASSAQPGQRFEIYRIEREIKHPVTGNSLGYMTRVVGTATVKRLDAKYAIALIDGAFAPIMRGDYVGPLRSNDVQYTSTSANSKELKGYIVDTELYLASMAGTHYVVFIDQGTKNGVQNGNTFDVLRAGDGFTGETGDFPDETIGQLKIIDARTEVSTALVTAATRELFAGDRVHMQVSR